MLPYLVQNNKPVTDPFDTQNKCREADYLSTFDFSTSSYHSIKFWSYFCFEGGESKYIPVRSYGIVMIQSLVSFLIIVLQLILKSSTKILVFLWGLIYLLFSQLTFYFYESERMNEIKNNDITKARKICTFSGLL